MINSLSARYLLAISLSLMLHLLMFSSWSDTQLNRARLEQPKPPPLHLLLNFNRLLPKVVQQPPPEVVEVAKPPAKQRPKPKTKKTITNKSPLKPKKQTKPKVVTDPSPTPAEKPPEEVVTHQHELHLNATFNILTPCQGWITFFLLYSGE